MHIFNARVYLGIRNGFVSLPDWNGTVVANFCEAPHRQQLVSFGSMICGFAGH